MTAKISTTRCMICVMFPHAESFECLYLLQKIERCKEFKSDQSLEYFSHLHTFERFDSDKHKII